MDHPPSRPQTFLKRVRRMLVICIAIYVVVCLGFASWQRRMLYFPQKLSSQQVDEEARQAHVERWKDAAGQIIGMKRLSPTQPAQGQVLLTYGNGSWAVGSARYADALQAVAAFDVYILEYPGYVDRPGSPSQKSIFQAADAALRELPTNVPTYLIGESLGGGVASYLAGTHADKIAGVVLFAPFNRLADVAQYHMYLLPVRLILLDRFPSQDYLRNYHGPVGILVGGRDNVVPEKFGRRLYDAYAGPKRLWEFPDADHMGVTEQPPDFWKDLIAFWQANRR